MKAKKAIKRLHRVETLLETVIEQYDACAPEVHDLLDAARSSVAGANQALAASPAKKPPSKADLPRARSQSSDTRKRPSVAAAKPSRKTA
jgi:hypothetical protein